MFYFFNLVCIIASQFSLNNDLLMAYHCHRNFPLDLKNYTAYINTNFMLLKNFQKIRNIEDIPFQK